MTVLLYKYVFNISLNVLRPPTFFNICNLPFFTLSKYHRKIRVKVGPKTNNYFSYFMSSCTKRIAVLSNFFALIYIKPSKRQTKPYPRFFLLLNIFWIISSWSFSSKMCFQNSSNYCYKNELLTIRWNAGTVLCSSLLEMCAQRLKLIVWAIFVLELVKREPPRNHSLDKFL